MEHSKPIKDFVSLFKAGTLSQVLTFLSIPVILKKYDPAEFGHFTIVISIATLAGVISSLRIERALVIEREEALSYLLRLCGLLTLVSSLICFALIYIFTGLIGHAGDRVYVVALCGAVYCLVTGLSQIISHLAIRQSRSPIIGFSDLLFAVSLLGLLLALPAGAHGAQTLMLIYTVSRTVGLAGYAKLDLRKHSYWMPGEKLTFTDLKKYTHPVWTTILSNLQFRGIYYLSGISYGAMSTGNISLAHRIMYSPVNLIGTALRRAYFKEFSHDNEKAGLVNHHISSVLKFGSLISLGGFPVLAVVLKTCGHLIPEGWAELPAYVLVLYPAASILILLSWLDRVYDARGMQHKALQYELIYTLALYAVLLLSLNFVAVLSFLKIYTVITVVYNVIWALLTLRLLGIQNQTIWFLGFCHVVSTAAVLITV